MGNEYLKYDALSEKAMSKNEKIRTKVRQQATSDDDSLRFVASVGLDTHTNDYYIQKYLDETYDSEIEDEENDLEGIENDLDDDEDYEEDETVDNATKYLINEFIDFRENVDKVEIQEAKENYIKAMDDFQDTISSEKCTEDDGMNNILGSIEENLKSAVRLLEERALVEKLFKAPIKSSDVKDLIKRFNFLKLTEWENPVKYLPKTKDPLVKAKKIIYRTQFFNAYEREVRTLLDKFENFGTESVHRPLNESYVKTDNWKYKIDNALRKVKTKSLEKIHDVKRKIEEKIANSETIEKHTENNNDVTNQVASLLVATLRPSVRRGNRLKENTGKHNYEEIVGLARIADKNYDEDRDSRWGSTNGSTLELAKDDTTNMLLHRLLAILLAQCPGNGCENNYVKKILEQNDYKFKDNYIWDKDPIFGDKPREEVKNFLKGDSVPRHVIPAADAFNQIVFGEMLTSTKKKLDYTSVTRLIKPFTTHEVYKVIDLLKLEKINFEGNEKSKYEEIFDIVHPKK